MDIEKILNELRTERDRIGKAINALLEGAGIVSSSNGTGRRGRPRGRGKGMSAAGRKRLSEAMKARWAARRVKPASTTKAASSTAPKRRGMSAAGRKRIAEAMKKRWAEKRKTTAQTGGERKAQA